MADIEIIEFKPPQTTNQGSPCLHLTLECGTNDEVTISSELHSYFSQYGLIFNINIGKSEDCDGSDYYSYIRYYSVRSACKAKQSNKGKIVISDGQIGFRVSRKSNTQPTDIPLSRQKCEELANYYLGFNGWSSELLYHRKEEVDPGVLSHVSVVRLSFPQWELDCEGAGKCDAAELKDSWENHKLLLELGKRSKGEATQAAWSKVVLVITDGTRVSLEINTTKKDKFFYDPTWEDPAITVDDVDY